MVRCVCVAAILERSRVILNLFSPSQNIFPCSVSDLFNIVDTVNYTRDTFVSIGISCMYCGLKKQKVKHSLVDYTSKLGCTILEKRET